MDSVTFKISNPSPYTRSDYIQADLETLGLPADIEEENLELHRIDGKRTHQVPFQIDYPIGSKGNIRVLVFLATGVPPSGSDHYTQASAEYMLKPGTSRPVVTPDNPWIGYYHSRPKPGEPDDGFNRLRDSSRELNGVKLANGSIEIYFSLVPGSSADRNAKGAVTSAISHAAFEHTAFRRNPNPSGEILSPFWNDPAVFWGQITQLSFFPMPWERKWFYKHKLRESGYKYEPVYFKSGPVRATAVFKVGPITISYAGDPVFSGTREIECDFYRMLYLYPREDPHPEDSEREYEKPFYMEELFVLMRHPRRSIPFRPYYASVISPDEDITELRRFEHIPDYFVVWKHFGPHYRGYGFASDAHVRGLELQHGIQNQKVFWRLPLSHHNRCVHYFWFLPEIAANFDPFHAIGHKAWYEKIFKPLAPVDPQLRFPSPIKGSEDDRAEVT